MLRQLREKKAELEKQTQACNLAIAALEEGFDLPELIVPKALASRQAIEGEKK